jgi:arsenite methyltransferase
LGRPLGDNAVDAVISNCVINLSPDKGRVFREALRVLKPGGRLMVSDLVLLKELPENVRQYVEAYVGCIAGAMRKQDYLAAIGTAGFHEVTVVGEDIYPIEPDSEDGIIRKILDASRSFVDDAKELSGSVASLKVSAMKPI